MMILFFKSLVPGHVRKLKNGRIVFVRPYDRRGTRALKPEDEQLRLFPGLDDQGAPGKSQGARRRKPRKPRPPDNEQQLRLDFDTAPIEWRPKPDKQAAFDALKLTYRLGKKGSLLGLGVTMDFLNNGASTLIGKQIKSVADLGTAAQIYRDPRFETFRYIGTKNGKVVGVLGFTSRLPDAAPIGPSSHPVSIEQEVREQLKQLKAMGADGFWMTHNHPSGNATPSRGDIVVTSIIAREARKIGIKTHGHVVVDSGEYASIRIDPDFRPAPGSQFGVERHHALYQLDGDDPILKPSKPHSVLGRKLTSPKAVVQATYGLLDPKAGHAVLLALDNKRRVRAVIDAPCELIDDATRSTYPASQAAKARQGWSRARVYLRRIARSIGSTAIIAVLPKNDPRLLGLKDLIENGYLLDATTIGNDDTLGGRGLANPRPYADALTKREHRRPVTVTREGGNHA